MKSIWKGSISFGLVSIRVRLYSAVQEHSLGFTLLHNKCHNPIVYKRWCTHCKKEVEWSDVVKGLKLEDGSYFILTQEKLKELKPAKSDTIDIVEFVDASQIEAIYLEHHYYMGPETASEKAFFLFKKALEESGKVAIGTFVMRDKQYACVINPYDQSMLLTTLNYAYEIRPLKEVPYIGAQPTLNASELKLAEQLIDKLTVKKFDLGQFKDTFAQQLKEAIKKGKKEKVTGKKSRKKEEVAPKKKRKEEGALISNLRASLIAPGRGSEIARAKSVRARKR